MLAAAVVTAGVTSFAVLMVMVIAVNIGIVAQISVEQCAHRRVSVPADTAVELDARFGQSCLRTAADASANQSVHAVLHQEACQCAVTAAVGVNNFRMNDFAVRSLIKLELFGVAEMLKDLTVFIGNCNFHNGISFAIFVGFFCVGSLHPAAAAAVGCLLSSADAVVSPGDVQRFPVDKTRCDLAPCAFVNLLHGRAGNVHLRGTLLVGLPLQVNQPNDLVLVQRQQDRLGIPTSVGTECIDLWCATNPTARGSLSIDTLFLLHIDYTVLPPEKSTFISKATAISILVCIVTSFRQGSHVPLHRRLRRCYLRSCFKSSSGVVMGAMPKFSTR